MRFSYWTRPTSWSRTAQKVIGYKVDEILGEHFGVLYRPDERRAGEPNRAIELAIQKGKHEVEGWRVRKNGALFRSSAAPHRPAPAGKGLSGRRMAAQVRGRA